MCWIFQCHSIRSQRSFGPKVLWTILKEQSFYYYRVWNLWLQSLRGNVHKGRPTNFGHFGHTYYLCLISSILCPLTLTDFCWDIYLPQNRMSFMDVPETEWFLYTPVCKLPTYSFKYLLWTTLRDKYLIVTILWFVGSIGPQRMRLSILPHMASRYTTFSLRNAQ